MADTFPDSPAEGRDMDSLAVDPTRTRVVALLSWESFEAQEAAYREAVLPRGVLARVAVEAPSPFGRERCVGDEGTIVGIGHFRASAAASVLYREFGITADNVVRSALKLVKAGR